MLNFLGNMLVGVSLVVGVYFLLGIILNLNYKWWREKRNDEHEFGYNVMGDCDER